MYPAKSRSGAAGHIANSVWLGGLIVASVALLLLSRSDAVLSRTVQTALADLTAPLLRWTAEPAARIRLAVSDAGAYAYLLDEVSRLREENRRLKALAGTVDRLERRVERYRALLNATADPDVRTVVARVVADAGSPFVRSILIDAGGEHGVRSGRAVIDPRGLVGQTVSVGRKVSRVLLLTDLNSRVPVRVEPAGYRAILAGDNSQLGQLAFLPIGAAPNAGDRVVTSGHGGVFPDGLPVGSVVTGDDGVLRVSLAAPPDYVQFVSVVEQVPLPPLEEPVAAAPAPVGEVSAGAPGQDEAPKAAALEDAPVRQQ